VLKKTVLNARSAVELVRFRPKKIVSGRLFPATRVIFDAAGFRRPNLAPTAERKNIFDSSGPAADTDSGQRTDHDLSRVKLFSRAGRRLRPPADRAVLTAGINQRSAFFDLESPGGKRPALDRETDDVNSVFRLNPGSGSLFPLFNFVVGKYSAGPVYKRVFDGK
jgi:hypothetical protein